MVFMYHNTRGAFTQAAKKSPLPPSKGLESPFCSNDVYGMPSAFDTGVHACECKQIHKPLRVVLTGGPGAGKTATLEMIKQSFCSHVRVLPEAAGIVFGGGFPRFKTLDARKASQRAIFHVQRELEAAVANENAAVILCDRGTVDGLAYWPGPDDFWQDLGTTLAAQLSRYDAVIHLRTPSADGGYDRSNPLRTETAVEAAAIDERLLHAWETHPRRLIVPNSLDFQAKPKEVIEYLRALLPSCCRGLQLDLWSEADRRLGQA